MSYAAWGPPHRVTTISPGRFGLFVATFIDGKRANVQPIMEYEAALAKARAFHADHPKCQIKVLPMDGKEFRNLSGIKPANPSEPTDPALRQEMAETLTDIARSTTRAMADREARLRAAKWLADVQDMLVTLARELVALRKRVDTLESASKRA